jgi:undecaprenyl-diphosphatase
MTLGRVNARLGWLVPTIAVVFGLLAVGAAVEALPWDRPITDAAVSARTPDRNDFALAVSRLGSTPVVLAVAALAAAFTWRRCRRLAIAIIFLALARPLVEFGFKELVGRDRPTGDRLVVGRGPSFPSGHPFAAAASWGFIPLVIALYTRRRALWWAATIAAWGLVVLIAVSRVWLGVHWTSDVVGGILLALLGVVGSERLIVAAHHGAGCAELRQGQMSAAARVPSG